MENETNFNDIFSNIGLIAERKLKYGSGGSGKSVNTLSDVAVYLAAGYKVLYVVTENNGLAGLKQGLGIYRKILEPFITKDNFFLADLTGKISETNREFLNKASSAKKDAVLLSYGAMYELAYCLMENPRCYALLDSSKTMKQFLGVNNLTTLSPASKVLVVIDGYSPVDDDIGGFAYFVQQGQKTNTQFFWGGLKTTGTSIAKQLIEALNIDLIILAHDRTQAASASSLITDPTDKAEAIKKEELLEEQLQGAIGLPAIGNASSLSKFLGTISVTLHATDNRIADKKTPRFTYDLLDTKNKTMGWYTRYPETLRKLIVKNATKNEGVPYFPQDGSHIINLTYMLQEGKLSEEAFNKLLTLTGQKDILTK